MRALRLLVLAALSSVLAGGVVNAAPRRAERDPAAAAVKRAKAAARKGDYAAALVDFETASELASSAAIHFNIGVCHHALMLAAGPETPEHASHREAAIAAYRAYLEASPIADDRADVERIITELLPTAPEDPPPTGDAPPPGPPPDLREAVTRIDPDQPATEKTADEPTAVEPPPPLASSRSPARVGPFTPVVLAHLGRLGDTDLVERMPLLGLGIRGGVFLGTKARVNLGAEFAAYGQPSDAKRRHRLFDAHVAATVEYGVSLGRARRFQLAGGGMLGFLYESLSRDGTSTLACPADQSGQVARRGGLLLGPRLALLVLLGRRRNHELGLRITPALAVTGNGNSGDPPTGLETCEQTPFAEVGLPGGTALVTTVDLGYAPRF